MNFEITNKVELLAWEMVPEIGVHAPSPLTAWLCRKLSTSPAANVGDFNRAFDEQRQPRQTHITLHLLNNIGKEPNTEILCIIYFSRSPVNKHGWFTWLICMWNCLGKLYYVQSPHFVWALHCWWKYASKTCETFCNF